jgi:hypothetical protein
VPVDSISEMKASTSACTPTLFSFDSVDLSC